MMNHEKEREPRNREPIGDAAGAEERTLPAGSYEKPRIVTWSSEDLEKAGTSLNACVSFSM